MENDNELIKLVFLPEEENVTWIIRKPRLKSKNTAQNLVESLGEITSIKSKQNESSEKNYTICKKTIETSEYQKLNNKDNFNSSKEQKKSVNQISKQGNEIQTRPLENSETKKLTAYNQNGKTIRGNEIQKILCNLQEETKRKNLNPIEKENLQNTLLSLQKEMTENVDKFSKFDSIPVRLNQVANYLDRLKDKETQKNKDINSSLSNKPAKEQQEKEVSSKKEKMKVIWKFGL